MSGSGGWQQVSAGSTLPPAALTFTRPAPVSVMACDPYKELLWSGSTEGHLICQYATGTYAHAAATGESDAAAPLEVRIRVQAHERGSTVLTLAPFQRGVLSAASTGVKFHARGGAVLAQFNTDAFCRNATAAATIAHEAQAFPSPELLLAGYDIDDSDVSGGGPNLCLLDVMTNQLLGSVLTGAPSACVASGRVLACGGAGEGADGTALSLFDPRDLSLVRSLPGHAGGSRRLLLRGDRLVSLGWSVGPGEEGYGGRADQLIKVYDLRTFRPLPPLLFSLGGGPAEAAFVPSFSSTLCVASSQGVWQTLDAEAGVPDAFAYQVELGTDASTGVRASLTSMCLSAGSGDMSWVFFGDDNGMIHGWTDKSEQAQHGLDEIPLNAFSLPTDVIHAPSDTPVHLNEFSSLGNAFPLPLNADRSSLLSSSPNADLLCRFPPPPTPPIDERIVHMNYLVKFQHGLGFISAHATARKGPNATGPSGMDSTEEDGREGKFIPNHLPTLLRFAGKGRRVDRLHQKKTLLLRSSSDGRSGTGSNALIPSGNRMNARRGAYYALQRSSLISKEYARVTISIPRHGLYAFDFSSYNKTHFTGLDNLLPNSYVNAVIQVLYFHREIRSAMKNHLCEKENCLMCELGFLFHMLDTKRGMTAEPRNFLRALRQLPEAGGLGLLDMNENSSTMQSPHTASSQSVNTVINTMGVGGKLIKGLPPSSADSELFLASKIQDFIRFFLEQLHKEERESASFQSRCHQQSQILSQLRYVYDQSQQRRARNFQMNISQLQQNFSSLQGFLLPPHSHPSAAVAQNVVNGLRHQLNTFVNQAQSLHDETEQLEQESFQHECVMAERAMNATERTTVENVFGAVVQQHVWCQGSAQGHAPHHSVLDKDTLYFKLNAYPLHEADCTFDGLLTNSLRDNSGTGLAMPASSGGGPMDGAAGLSTQRLFCNSCSTFTIQSSCKTLKPCNTDVPANASATLIAAAPIKSYFPAALNIQCNVTTDLEWEWWKRRDERFQRYLARRGTNNATHSARAHQPTQLTTGAPTNLYGRFMAAAGVPTNPPSQIQQQKQQQQQQLPSVPELVFNSNVVNAGAAMSHRNTTISAAAASSPVNDVTDASFDKASEVISDALDVHFLPHYMLLIIDSHTTPGSPQTRAFRVLPSQAMELSACISEIRAMQSAYVAEQQALTQQLLSTQLSVCQLQAQMLTLAQQSFFVQSKLNSAVNQHTNLMHSLNQLAQQASQLQSQPGGVPPQLQQQMHSMRTSLAQLQNQSQLLQGQKVQIQQSVQALQASNGGNGGNAPAPGTAAGAAAAGSAGLVAQQNRVAQLQNQVQSATHQHMQRMNEAEAEMRKLIIAHLSIATPSPSTSTPKLSRWAGDSSSGSNAPVAAVSYFSPSMISQLVVGDVALYELSSVVAHVADPPEKDSPLHSINGEHLVAHIKVERSSVDDSSAIDSLGQLALSKALTPPAVGASPPRFKYGVNIAQPSPLSPTTNPAAVSLGEHDGAWFVFNDFVIRPSHAFEAARFNYMWKQPCAVVYKLMGHEPKNSNTALIPRQLNSNAANIGGMGSVMQSPLQHPLSPSESNPFLSDAMIYSHAPSLSARFGVRGGAPPSFQPLSSRGPTAELMERGTLVAIDCEFVSVQHELLARDADTGEEKVVRPARLTLARVSVIRGEGPLAGVPFIDDYICSSEQVVDYLTQYSGITPGDLDRSTSPHYLTTMKHAYVRLRALVERGVRFVGHGLKKDFQMLNLTVPAEQICDTVELFCLPNQRKLGLRFLATHLLNVNIQVNTHDSIEDARTALQLYRKYMQLKQQGSLQQCIHALYEAGHRSGFKL
jgi:hypothetical protein